jgi:hypothetical protein
MTRSLTLACVALALGCSQPAPVADGGKDASFDGIPTVCGVLVDNKDICIHCSSQPGTSETCHQTCTSTDAASGCVMSPPDASVTSCGTIACGYDCTCFDPVASVCQCTL